MKIILNSADFSIVIPEVKVEFTYGKISGGSIISDTTNTRAVSDFIDVRNGSYIVGLFSDFLYSGIDFITYDENKTKISSAGISLGVYVSTENVSYIRFSAKRTNNATFDLEDISDSFMYRLTNVYNQMFIYGTVGTGGVFLYNNARIISNAIPISGTKVSVSISNSNFVVVELDAWDSSDNYIGKVSQNTTISSSVAYIKIIVKNTNNANILPDALKDSEVTITWT